MSAKTLVLALVGTASVAAAAGGGYVALRMNNADRAVATVGAPNPPAERPSAPATPQTAAPRAASSQPPVTSSTSTLPVSRKNELPQQTQAPKKNTSRVTQTSSAPQTPVASQTVAASSAPSSQTATAPVPVAPPPVAPPIAPPVVVPAAAPPATGDPSAAAPPPTVPDPVPPVSSSTSTRFEELLLATDSVIGIRLESTVSSQNARVEDKVIGVVTRDVNVGGRTAIPAGARIEGIVQSVQAGGKFKNQPRLGLRFNRVLLPDNTKLPIQTETIFREGESPTNEAVAKVGAGTVVGSILGALIGGKKGAAIGAGAGAAGSTAAVAAGDPNNVVIVSGTVLTVRLTAPVSVTIERHDQ